MEGDELKEFGAVDREGRDQNKHVFRNLSVSNTECDTSLNLTQAAHLPARRLTPLPHIPEREAKAQS